MKKHYLLALLFTFLATAAFSQTGVSFSYDAAGNRIIRKVIPLRIGRDTTIKDQAGAFNFVFYPNPTSDKLTMQIDPSFMAEQNKKAFLYDLTGKLLQETEVVSTSLPFDLTSYAPGFYILRVSAKGYSAEWKVVKQ